MPNRLAGESSPYLLQHAHNPVDWYPWGEEALEKARREDKPILLSIGYSACHWCHVMERESFEEKDTASVMNADFVNIKVDREERPDLDHIYMDAVQSMTGSGGWPLNVFLTPAGKPFYGGTYFPPRPAFNRPSWKEILLSVSRTFREKREEIEIHSTELTNHLIEANNLGLQKINESGSAKIFSRENITEIFGHIMKMADKELGGFGKAPKFPQTFIIRFLLQYYYYSKNEDALEQACLSLDKMIGGGIYDQVGGGFARYATDDNWLVPHFEKMLYDNALLITVISEAYQLTGKQHYRRTVIRTVDFIFRELLSNEQGFYAALDADSEGEEGKYYVWDIGEIDSILEEESPLFCDYYNVTSRGNWEGKNILHTSLTEEEFASKNNLPTEEVIGRLEASRKKLLSVRRQRIPPLLDDKILLGWNALMIVACCKAYSALGVEEYKEKAVLNAEFLWKKFKGEGVNYFHHNYKNGKASIPAFLDDYACFISALIELQEITGDAAYLLKAKELTEFVIDHFSDENTDHFYFSHKDQENIIMRKKEVYDGAIPSGNAVMAYNLFYLSVIFDKPSWKERAIGNCGILARAVIHYPGSFAIWATMIQAITYGTIEVVITGKNLGNIFKEFLSNFIPNRVFQSATIRNNEFPLLKEKPLSQKPLIFLCQEYSCQNPVTEVHELIRLLETVQKFNI
jgi:uncharacterized protein YyaL (SSP411 family)